MVAATDVVRDVPIPAELTAWATRLRAGVIVGLYALLMAGYRFARLPIAPAPIMLIALAAVVYNGILAAVVWRSRERPAPNGDRIRARVLYAGGFLDAVAMALIVWFTGGLVSPWLYFFLATTIASNAILPPTAGRVITAINAAAAVTVIIISTGAAHTLVPFAPGSHEWAQPAYAVIVGLSLVGLMCLTAYTVSVPVESARNAARFQEGLAQIALLLQRSTSTERALQAVCSYTQEWFDVSRTVIMLLEGEELVVRAATGGDGAAMLGRRTPVNDPHSPEVEVLRRRAGFYINVISRSPRTATPLVEENHDRALLAVPLLGSLGVMGVLTMVHRERRRRFTPTLLQQAGIVAAQAGAAIENARLLERVREEADRVTALLAALEALTKSHDLSSLLTDLNRMAAEMAGCSRSATFLWDAQRQVFYFGSLFGEPTAFTDAVRRLEFARGSFPLIERILAGESFVIGWEQVAAVLAQAVEGTMRLGTTAVIPLITEQAVQGVMSLSHPDCDADFSAEQLWMLRGVARYAALAIERTRFIEGLRRANRLKSDFLSTVSHELRTPLNAIIGYTDLLRERALGPLLPEQLEVADIVAKKGIQLLELINTTLDLTRLEAGQVGVEVSEFSLLDLLQEVQQELADEVPALVEFRLSGNALPPMVTDRLKLKTVIKNLAHNALKFTRRGIVELRAASAPDPRLVEIVVEDTGIGIAADNVAAIFEMFRQLEPALTRRFGGVGLGLYIVQRLLELLRGEIRVQSEPGRGSVFAVTVPARLPPDGG